MQIAGGRLPENSIPCELLGACFSFGCRGTIQLLQNLWSSEEPSELLSFILKVFRENTADFFTYSSNLWSWGATLHISLFKSRCDYLSLCGFVTLQPPAADQEIMQSQTHCDSQEVGAQLSPTTTLSATWKDRMLTKEEVICLHHAYTAITLHGCQLSSAKHSWRINYI